MVDSGPNPVAQGNRATVNAEPWEYKWKKGFVYNQPRCSKFMFKVETHAVHCVITLKTKPNTSEPFGVKSPRLQINNRAPSRAWQVAFPQNLQSKSLYSFVFFVFFINGWINKWLWRRFFVWGSHTKCHSNQAQNIYLGWSHSHRPDTLSVDWLSSCVFALWKRIFWALRAKLYWWPNGNQKKVRVGYLNRNGF